MLKLSEEVLDVLEGIIKGLDICLEDFEQLDEEEQKLTKAFVTTSIKGINEEKTELKAAKKKILFALRRIEKSLGKADQILSNEEYYKIFMQAVKIDKLKVIEISIAELLKEVIEEMEWEKEPNILA
ncbi:MAG: hypothetical protein ACLU8F_01120 [Clostridia bacterium]